MQRTISEDAVDSALESWVIDDALEGWRDLGGGDAEDGSDEESRLDRILVYATINRDGFTQAEMLRLLEEMGHPVEPERVRRCLKRLELAYILGRSGSGSPGGGQVRTYTYQVPLFVQRIGEQEPEVLLEKELSSGTTK